MEWGQKFLGAGEAFLGEEAVELRAILAETTAKFFDSYHHSNMEVSLNIMVDALALFPHCVRPNFTQPAFPTVTSLPPRSPSA